jgi:hypothetical protein
MEALSIERHNSGLKGTVYWRGSTAVSIGDFFMDFLPCMKHLQNPDYGDSAFSETSVEASGSQYQAHEDIFSWHRRESPSEVSDLQI